jgi:hypothetical protein
MTKTPQLLLGRFSFRGEHHRDDEQTAWPSVRVLVKKEAGRFDVLSHTGIVR